MVLEALGHRLVDDVEPVEVVVDLRFDVRDASGETLVARDILQTRHRILASTAATLPLLPAELHEGRAGA